MSLSYLSEAEVRKKLQKRLITVTSNLKTDRSMLAFALAQEEFKARSIAKHVEI